jgi:hypothetical protein
MPNGPAPTGYGEETRETIKVPTYEEAVQDPKIQKTFTDAGTQYMREAPQIVLRAVEQLSLPSDAKEVLTDPNKAREISNFVVGNDRDAFDTIIGKILQRQQKESLYVSMDAPLKSIIQEHLKKLYPSVHGTGTGKAVLVVGSEIGRKQQEYGDAEAQVNTLKGFGETLNGDERKDMLRAALEVGFSAASVFRMESEWNLSREAARKKSRKMPSSDEINIQMVATQVMREKLDKLREALDELRTKGEDEERRKKAMEAEKMLGYLVGNRRAGEARKMLSRQGAENDELVAKTLAEQLALSRELHSGHLGKVAVLPKTEGPR